MRHSLPDGHIEIKRCSQCGGNLSLGVGCSCYRFRKQNSVDQIRIDFEDWYKDLYGEYPREYLDGEGYEKEADQLAWLSWKAASLRRPEDEKPIVIVTDRRDYYRPSLRGWIGQIRELPPFIGNSITWGLLKPKKNRRHRLLLTPSLIARFAAYRNENPGWGCMHCVLEDGNDADKHIPGCIDSAQDRGDAEGEALAKILAHVSRTQRLKLDHFVDKYNLEKFGEARPSKATLADAQQGKGET